MDERKRIAIYGGTFDPVHLGHVEVARRVSELFEIGDLLFVPAQLAPHKLTSEVTPALHRYAMLALATQEDRRLCVSTFELEAPNRRYTVDTLAHFDSEYGAVADLFFVMGADSWAEIDTWREWERLLTMVNHIVVTRPGHDVRLGTGVRSWPVEVVDLRGAATFPPSVNGVKGKVFITDAVQIEISATEIRRAARDNRSDLLAELVTPPVAAYITKYKLYRDPNET